MEHLVFMELLAKKGIVHTPEEAKVIFQMFDKMFERKSEVKEVRTISALKDKSYGRINY